jgi:hypothetical protein
VRKFAAFTLIAISCSCPLVLAAECVDALRLIGKSTKSVLRTAELKGLCAAFVKNEITYSEETNSFTDPLGKDVPIEIRAKDLNRDGVREIFVHAQSSYWGGAKGDVLWLFVRKRATNSPYQKNLGFSTDGYTLLKQTHNGYPYIKVYPRAVCSAIWHWEGNAYAHACNIPETPKGCPDNRPLCPAQLTLHSSGSPSATR